tara:strand:+ start:23817 stop:24314 length:498 start_codon:yes stop_codon:yes gene_type:complete
MVHNENDDMILPHHGVFTLKVFDKDGNLKHQQETENIITNAGVYELGDLLIGAHTNTINYLSCGTGTAAPAVGDTDLNVTCQQGGSSSAAQVRKQVTSRTRTTNTLTFSRLLASGDYDRPATISELGVWFAPQATGDLFARGLLNTTVTLASGDTATLTYGILLR